jgi:hypothetical protein
MPRKHRFVHRGYLMGQRLNDGRMHGKKRIEQVGQPDSVRLCDQPEQRPSPSKLHGCPWPATSSRSSSWRNNSSFATFPSGVLYVSSMEFDPIQWIFTTVTEESGMIPFTAICC